jgi:hypothetical protein
MAIGVVTYINPVSGTVPPTAVQMLPLSRVAALVSFGDTDTTALITHNMNIPLLSSPAQHGLNSGSPLVIIGVTSPGTAGPVISFVRGTNTLALTKISAAGSGGTIEVQIERYEPLE